jgi:predicted PhzF superfamily epimerase YddE/YHI9
MSIPLFHVDAFAESPFSGNPAAVCVLNAARPDSWMRGIAAEMNLSETAFLEIRDDAFGLRWFTPRVEVDLCGHATLASAHVLWEAGLLPPRRQARFHTRGGLLTADKNGEWIELDFPAEPERRCDAPDGLARALGAGLKYVGKNRMDLLVEAETEAVVRNLRPDMAFLSQLPARGVIVTALCASGGYDFVSRFFAPGVGVDEDPVTGSAHCCLAPFWGERLGKNRLLAYQMSARGGVLRLELAGNRVRIGGKAVTIARGEIAQGI